MCCSVLQCVSLETQSDADVLQCDVVCCSVLQCVAVCCSVLQCVRLETQSDANAPAYVEET